jgi:Zn-dependent protease with chaperone function
VKARLRQAAAGACWLLLLIAVLAHAALALLAIAEFAAFGWPLPTWFDTGAVTLVLASAVAGFGATGLVATRAVAGSRALRAMIRSGSRQVPPAIQEQAATLGCTARLDVIASSEPFAVTYGLTRPRILVSTGLAAALDPAEIGAVLAHEREHVRHRDPLRLLAARTFAAWTWYLPAARWLADSLALRRELTADQAAARRVGRGVLAGALLKIASAPTCPAVAAAGAAGRRPEALEARVTQLEAGRPVRHRPAASRLVASAGTLSLLAPAFLCCAALSQLLPGGSL